MESKITLENVTALAAQLSPTDKLRLVEKIAAELVEAQSSPQTAKRRSWSEIRGAVAYPMWSEDAQHWVSQSRREADEQRSQQWRIQE